ncbi:glycosyltransferase family 39 protein [Lacrimispora indolis]|uniref:glycosyltransferase family 39 protein n=1 Tax=Lacrimispora indolis TaxID=69825 RepID=UPI00045EACD1|nr:glycosyltransferase family 39 protein [Lacrimispora indolis]
MNQRKEEKRRALLALIFILILQSGVMIWFGSQKQGYFIDEIYSFGLSNGYYKPFITSYGDEIFDRWADKTVINDYMTVQKGEGFAYGSVIYNQSQDVHPPVFYLLLHTVCSFFPGMYSKWFGIGINLVCFLLSGIFLWLLGNRLMKSSWLGLVPVVIWGFSAGAVSYTVYIRMYMAMTLFTVLSGYLHERMEEEGQSWRDLILIFLVTICGLLTQYYFVIFAFYLSAVYFLWKLWKRAFKEAFLYAAVLFGAVGTAVVLFPACITQLTRDDEIVAQETKKNIGNLDTLITNLKSYAYGINSDFLSGIYKAVPVILILAAGAVAAAFFLGRRKEGAVMDKPKGMGGWLFLLSCPAAVLTIASVAVVPSPRYICSLYPLLVLAGIWLLWRMTKAFQPAMRLVMALLSVLFLCLSLSSYRNGFVQYLYRDEPVRLEEAKRYGDLSCLYVTNYRMAALTQDLRTLSCYREFYVTSKEGLADADQILEGRDVSRGMLVTVDNNAFWGSGYDAEEVVREICEKTGLISVKCVFAQELSVTYLLEY